MKTLVHAESRPAAAVVAAVVVACCCIGCHANHGQSRPAEDPPVFRLDRSGPAFIQVLQVTAEQTTVVGLRVPILRVRNPRAVPLKVTVSWIGADASRGAVKLGEHHLFPADRPATFVVPVPRASSIWPEAPGSVAVQVRLDAVDGATLDLDAVQLEVGPVGWER